MNAVECEGQKKIYELENVGVERENRRENRRENQNQTKQQTHDRRIIENIGEETALLETLEKVEKPVNTRKESKFVGTDQEKINIKIQSTLNKISQGF